MHKNLYHNRKGHAFNHLIKDIFQAAKPYLKFDEIIYDPEKYLNLTDNVLTDISRIEDDKIQALMKRITRREQYKQAGNGIILMKNSFVNFSKEFKEKIFSEFIGLQNADGGPQLSHENCFLNISSIKYCNQNQFDTILVYDNHSPEKKIRPLSTNPDVRFSESCYEYIIEIFVRDDRVLLKAKKAWEKFLQTRKGMFDILS